MKQDWLSLMLDKIYSKLDKIEDRLNSIDVTAAEQQKDIKIHIKRTNILESTVLGLRSNKEQWKGVAKFILVLAAVSGIVTLYITYFGK